MRYGDGDASFRAAGDVDGITALVDRFYAVMDTLPEAETIRHMHPEDLTVSRDKLARFLCGWLGGPRRYQEKYGSIRIPMVHARFDIGEANNIVAGDLNARISIKVSFSINQSICGM